MRQKISPWARPNDLFYRSPGKKWYAGVEEASQDTYIWAERVMEDISGYNWHWNGERNDVLW